MKTLILSTIFILLNLPSFSQNILEALALKNDWIGEYVEGEARSTDTIIDLKNGYYEEFSSVGADNKTIIRQAAVFRNHDGSTTLGVSTASWDFQCYVFETNFYEIPKRRDSIYTIANDEILPALDIRAFLPDSTVLTVLNQYVPAIKEQYLGSNATIDEILSEVYDIVYLLPQKGTTLIAALRVCDYIPTNEVNIHPDDWAIIKNVLVSIELEYDKAQKVFKRR